jgi:hypothetical protein
MPRYYLLVDNRPIKFSAALDQLKEFALTTFSSTSLNLKIQEFGQQKLPALVISSIPSHQRGVGSI